MEYDIHTLTAAEVYGVNPQDVTSEQRSKAKVRNFARLYGQNNGLTVHEVCNFLAQADYAAIEMAVIACEARRHGYVQIFPGTFIKRTSHFRSRRSKRRSNRNANCMDT